MISCANIVVSFQVVKTLIQKLKSVSVQLRLRLHHFQIELQGVISEKKYEATFSHGEVI